MRIVLGWLMFGGRLAAALPAEGFRHIWKRLPLFLLLWLVAGVLAALHLLGFFLDQILFRGYRKITVRRPVFIVGIPRSGTTFLQRVLSEDSQFTTLTLWECVLAPSISERYFWSAIGELARPLSAWAKKRPAFFARMDNIHRIRLNEPEEDFLLLSLIQSCFLAVIPCPNSENYWRLARFDDALNAKQRKAVMDFYYRCLQRHLYFHGADKRLLSKNPSFTPFIDSLRATFPDAHFVVCARDPVEAVPSQLSSLVPAFELFGGGVRPEVSQRMVSVLHHYYLRVRMISECEDVSVIPMAALKTQLAQTVRGLYEALGQALPETFIDRLEHLDTNARAHRSEHHYRAEDFGLTVDSIRARFADVWPGADGRVTKPMDATKPEQREEVA